MSGDRRTNVAARPDLSASVRRGEHERRLAAQLPGRELPDVQLTVASHRVEVPLRQRVIGVTVIYLLPGEAGGKPWLESNVPTPDAAQHRGYIRRHTEFSARGVKVIGIASQPVEELLRLGQYLRPDYLLLADPDRRFGAPLDLPHDKDGRYRRIVLLTDGTRITRMFAAVERAQAATSARQVLSWLSAQ